MFDLNIHPIEEILKLLPQVNERDQLKTWLEILPYCAAKMKDVQDDDALAKELAALSDEELRRRVKEALGKAA